MICSNVGLSHNIHERESIMSKRFVNVMTILVLLDGGP